MNEQEEIALKLPEPAIKMEEIAELVGVLRAAGGWQTAAGIAARRAGWTERKVRAIASVAAPEVVSFPGSPGYKLWALCSVEEINRCIEAFESQAGDMMKRAVAYRCAYHRRFRGAPGGNVQEELL
jgi:hypothetical protein